jgi:hypothetical protein
MRGADSFFALFLTVRLLLVRTGGFVVECLERLEYSV